MIPKEFDAITKADIDALVANAVAESRSIEYKQQLPSGTDDDKRELLSDISSFANAVGGDLIFGIADKRDSSGKPTGIPDKADGLAGINADAEIRRLDEIIRSGIDPRIPGYRIRQIEGFAAGPVLIIRVPKSWVSPHMITFKNLSRFFTRSSAGKQQMDVREIRSAFTASGDLRSKITAFQTERLGKIIANETPVRLPQTPKLVIHLVPLSILDFSAQVDLTPLDNDPNLSAPVQNRSYNNRHNLDGFLSYNSIITGGVSRGYAQIFRSGAFEVVDAELLQESNVPNLVASTHVEQKILQSTTRYFNTAKRIGTPVPFILMLTVFGVNGYAIATGSTWENANPSHGFDRDTLLLPDVLIEDYKTPTDVALKPIFDAFWQSAGFPACWHYNQQGRWSALTNYQ